MSTSSQPRRFLPYGIAWYAATGILATAMMLFLILPVLALTTTLSWQQFTSGLGDEIVWPAVILTVQTTLTSLLIIIVFGTPLAWLLSRRDGLLSQLIETFARLPAVLPPAVAGVALLLAFGKQGFVGETFGWKIPFTTLAVVLAEVFVAMPYYLQAATSSFRNLDESQLTVAQTLGAGPSRVFFTVALPQSLPGLISGAAMAWARALGEFGATLLFAGRLTGETETLTLAVYTLFEKDLRKAQAVSVILVIVAFAVLLTLQLTSARSGKRRQ